MNDRSTTSGMKVGPRRRKGRKGNRLLVTLFYCLFALFGLGGVYFGYVFVYNMGFLLGAIGPGFLVGSVPAPPGPFTSSELASPWTGKDRLNILLLGLDQRDDEIGIPSRSDTMIVLTIDPVNKTAGMLSVPRDLWVPIPGVGENKINTAHFFGEQQRKDYGPILAKKTVEYNFRIPIHYYARVNFRGFEKLIDAIGGIDVDVPRPVLDDEYPIEGGGIKRIYIPAGWQHMDGRTALEYARSRHSDSDFGRSRRQQQVLVAAKERALRLEMLPKLPGLLGILRDSVTTDIPPANILSLAQLARSINSQNITSAAIDGSMVTEVNRDQLYYLHPQWAEIRELVAKMFAVPEGAESPLAEHQPARIAVMNGTTRVGFAAMAGSFLKDKGFVVVRIDDADRDDYKETLIIDHTGKSVAARNIARLLNVPMAEVSRKAGNVDVDITVVLGEDARLPGRN